MKIMGLNGLFNPVAKGRLMGGDEQRKAAELGTLLAKEDLKRQQEYWRENITIKADDYNALLQLTTACMRFSGTAACPDYLHNALDDSLVFRKFGKEPVK
jgi:hypothetical protein